MSVHFVVFGIDYGFATRLMDESSAAGSYVMSLDYDYVKARSRDLGVYDARRLLTSIIGPLQDLAAQ